MCMHLEKGSKNSFRIYHYGVWSDTLFTRATISGNTKRKLRGTVRNISHTSYTLDNRPCIKRPKLRISNLPPKWLFKFSAKDSQWPRRFHGQALYLGRIVLLNGESQEFWQNHKSFFRPKNLSQIVFMISMTCTWLILGMLKFPKLREIWTKAARTLPRLFDIKPHGCTVGPVPNFSMLRKET